MNEPEPVQPPFSVAGMCEVERLASHAMVAELASASPDIARLLVDVALGDVLARPDLDARTRELLAVAMLAALGAEADFVGVHARAALEAGASASELCEVLLQVVTFAGFPAALRAFAVVREVIGRRGEPLPAPRSARAVVVAFFDALTAGDTARAVDMAAPDALWSIPGDASLVPWVGRQHGRPAIARFYAALQAETETESLALGSIVAHGELVFVRGEFAYRFPRNQGHYADAFVIVLTVRGGLIARYEMHEDSLEMARAFQNAS